MQQSKSFAEVMGKPKKIEEDDKTENRENIMGCDMLSFKTASDETKWLKNCFTCLLKKEFSWDIDEEEILSECGGVFRLAHMGDNVILLNNISGKDLSKISSEFDEWFSHWFDWYRVWKPVDACHKRLVWTKWFGVPLHAWSERFFKTVCPSLGMFIKLDNDTMNKVRFDFARVLISVSYLKDVNQIIKVAVDNDIYSIKIVEDVDWYDEDEGGNQAEERSEASEELVGSSFSDPAAAEIQIQGENSSGIPTVDQVCMGYSKGNINEEGDRGDIIVVEETQDEVDMTKSENNQNRMQAL